MPARIYTRTGDGGETGLFGGDRVGKDDPRVEAYGTVDELNCALGVARAQTQDADVQALLGRLQSDLFLLGADLATPGTADETRGTATVTRLGPGPAQALELDIDRLEGELVALQQFILPGGCPLAASLHLARAVCRRAERRCVALAHAEEQNPEAVRYLNRLSDLLFVLARAANARAGTTDVRWVGSKVP